MHPREKGCIRCATPDLDGRQGSTVGSGGERSTPLSGPSMDAPTLVETDIPARLDRLPWSAWHWRVVIALGVTWVLDGLEVTLVGAVAGALVRPDTLGLTEQQVGGAATAYLAGAILGALFFGRLTDLVGRKRLFLVTLSVYLVATLLTAASTGFVTFALFRALTGAGIGGEYAAINSAIDELLPARVRGRADLAINGTYWLGTALGALSTLVLLDPHVLPPWLGWRVCFALGALLGISILLVRRHVPESPRWLLLHGRSDEAGPSSAGHRGGGDWPARTPRSAGEHRALPRPRRIGLPHHRAHPLPPAPAPGRARPVADGRAGLRLQRGLLHLRPRAGEVLRRTGRPDRPLPPPLRAGEPGRSAPARPPLRHRGPAADDRPAPTGRRGCSCSGRGGHSPWDGSAP